MNLVWLWVLLPSALALGGLLLWRWRRRCQHTAAGPRVAARGASPMPAAPAAPAPHRQAATPSPIEAQRLAATEALRQARQCKAAQAATSAVLAGAASARASGAVEASGAWAAASRPARHTAPAAVAASAISVAAVPGAAPAAVRLEAQAALASPVVVAPQASDRRPVLTKPGRPAGPLTVLLADDSRLVRVKTSRLLQQQGWQVLLAEDGLAAWAQLASASVDLLITDVEMPGLDGFELTRRLRADPRWRSLPVIMITGADDHHQAAARAAGVDLLLGKPYAEAELLAQAQRLAGRSRMSVDAGLALH